MDATLPDCPVIHVPREIMAAVVRVESARNPYAIGVVGGRLVRQPTNKEEALATLFELEKRGYNYSVGMAQVNRTNFQKYGINKANLAFDVCANLEAGSKILQECYSRSKGNWGNAFSCYYSGNFVTGYKHGYVQKVAQAYVEADEAATVGHYDKSLLAKPGPLLRNTKDGASIVVRPSAAKSEFNRMKGTLATQENSDAYQDAARVF